MMYDPRAGMKTTRNAVRTPRRMPGQEDLAEGLERPRAEVAGGLDQPEVELLRGRVDGQDRERQEGVDHDQHDGRRMVEEGRLRTDETDRLEEPS